MSYILEALKKAEQQRQLGQVPGIASNHDARVGRRPRHWLWFFALTVNVVIVGSLVAVWRAGNMKTASEIDVVPADRESHAPPVVVPPVSRVSQEQFEPRAPAYVDPPSREPDLGPASTDVLPGYGPPDQVHADPVGPVVEEPVRRTSLPVWPRVPDHLFERLGKNLRLDVHVYSDEPRSRFVLINLQKYHEGDTLPDGPVLDEITAEGVVLSLSGERFRLQAQ